VENLPLDGLFSRMTAFWFIVTFS